MNKSRRSHKAIAIREDRVYRLCMSFLATVAVCIVVNLVFLGVLIALARMAERRRPKPAARSQEAIIADVRGALDSERLDASIARITRRNRQRSEA